MKEQLDKLNDPSKRAGTVSLAASDLELLQQGTAPPESKPIVEGICHRTKHQPTRAMRKVKRKAQRVARRTSRLHNASKGQSNRKGQRFTSLA